MSNIHKRIWFVKRIQLPCVKIIIWPGDINFVMKRGYSLVVITCNYVFSDLSLQLHTKGKDCWQSCLKQKFSFICWNVSNHVSSCFFFLLVQPISSRESVRFLTWYLSAIHPFYFLSRKRSSTGANWPLQKIPQHTIMLFVCHPKNLNKHCFQFLLGPF